MTKKRMMNLILMLIAQMKASSENVNGYMREVDELALFEVEPDEIPSTLTGFSKNSILVGRENEEICRLDKKWYC